MAKTKTFSSAKIFLDNGYRFDLYIDDEIQDSVSTDFREAIEKESGTFWLGNWGDSIEAHLYDPRGRHVQTFREKIGVGEMPDIIIKQVVTYIGI